MKSSRQLNCRILNSWSTVGSLRSWWIVATAPRALLLSQPESQADREANRISRRAVDPSHSAYRLIRKPGHNEILCLPVALVIQVVDREVEVHAVPDPLGHAQVKHIQPGRMLQGIGGIRALQYVSADVAVV